MASKKNNAIQEEPISKYCIYDSSDAPDSVDPLQLETVITALQTTLLDKCTRLFRGWLVSGFAAAGYLERLPSECGRKFELNLVLSIRLTPYSAKVVDQLVETNKSHLPELPIYPLE